MSDLVGKILFTVSCLVLPVVWGVLVNWFFDAWQERTKDNGDERPDEPFFPDYQI